MCSSYLMFFWSTICGYPAAMLEPRRVAMTSAPDLGFALHSTHYHFTLAFYKSVNHKFF